MTEETKVRLLNDVDKFLNNIPEDWNHDWIRKNAKAYKSLLNGKRKTMAIWQQVSMLNCVCHMYGMQAVWNERTKICYIHVLDAPSCYGDDKCWMTYYGMFTASEVTNNIYSAMAETQGIFKEKYGRMPEFADSIAKMIAA